jgi:large subunit ribosomal protein L17
MKHRIGFNKLSRKSSHRKAMTNNMIISLFKFEQIRTTKAKAKEVRRFAEKMVTRAKIDSVHNRRLIAKRIKDKEILAKLFTEIGPRFKGRAGGYTRILKLGYRHNDAAEMVVLELLDRPVKEEKKKEKAPVKEAKKETAKIEEKATTEAKEPVTEKKAANKKAPVKKAATTKKTAPKKAAATKKTEVKEKPETETKAKKAAAKAATAKATVEKKAEDKPEASKEAKE